MTTRNYVVDYAATGPLRQTGRKSALGQTRTSADVCGTTASPPKADVLRSLTDVAEGPLRDIQTARRRNYSLTMRR